MKRWIKDVYIHICKLKIDINLLYAIKTRGTKEFSKVGIRDHSWIEWSPGLYIRDNDETSDIEALKLQEAIKNLTKVE